jgi:mono/diheme cytochrome c family protein
MSDNIKDSSSGHTRMNDEEMIDLHSELGREKHPPTKGFLIAPLIFVFVFGCLIFVCSIQLAHSTNSFQLHPPQEIVELTEEEKEKLRFERKFDSGKKIFALRCASCHQPNGLGIENQYPPLDGSEWVSADPDLITKVILKGLKGEIEVLGKKYGTSPAANMAAVPINDREIANVSTYVRNAWSNSASEVSEDDVARVRKETKEQKDQWIGEALEAEYLSNSSIN